MKRIVCLPLVFAIAMLAVCFCAAEQQHSRVGASVTIEGPESIERDTMAVLKASGSMSGAVWFCDPEDGCSTYDAGQNTLLFVGKPGHYSIKLVAMTGGTLSGARKTIEVVEKKVTPKPTPKPKPTPTPANPYKPAPLWTEAVKPVSLLPIQRSDSLALATGFSQVAQKVAKGEIADTASLRSCLVSDLGKIGLKGKYPNSSKAIEKVMVDALGLDNKSLDNQQAADLLTTLAWAVWQAGVAK